MQRSLALAWAWPSYCPSPSRRPAWRRKTRRHDELHDPGRCTAKLRRPIAERVCDGPRGGAILPHVIPVNPENPASTADFGYDLCYCAPRDRDLTLKLLTPRISNLMNVERTQRDAGCGRRMRS
jgi:hypothetical protein